MTAKFADEGTFVPNNWVIGFHRARKVVIKAGAGKLDEATVLGLVTADSKYLKSIKAATDGSQVPDAILSAPVDATDADVEAVVYVAGVFDQGALKLGAGHTLGSVDQVFRTKSIWLETTQG